MKKNYSLVENSNSSATLERFKNGIQQQMNERGYTYQSPFHQEMQIVFNFVDPVKPKRFRRKGKGTFVITVTENDLSTDHILKTAYPILVRSLGNMLIYLDHSGQQLETYFITLEQGCYPITVKEMNQDYFQEIFQRIHPLATAQLIIDNQFEPDLSEDLWDGDEITKKIYHAGKSLEQMNLLPTPFPIEELLSPRDLRHIQLLYGIGGLSYGNISARKDPKQFWMSASGVDKSNLTKIGQDILLIKGYDSNQKSMKISVPRDISPKRASVDAIEHWMIYREHSQVGAIVHIHAWMDGIESTEINYPCGTLELAKAVATKIRQAENPARTVIGLRNHGLTITGPDLDDIFERIEGQIIPHVPMS